MKSLLPKLFFLAVIAFVAWVYHLTPLKQLCNLLGLITILHHFLKEPVREFVKERHHSIGDQIKKVRETLHKAQEQYDEFTSKLNAVGAEVSAIRQQFKEEAEKTSISVLNQAKEVSAKVVGDANQAANVELQNLQQQLRRNLAVAVIREAENRIKTKLTGDDQQRFRQEFSTEVGRA